MDPETRFSEEEVQKILARAAQQQDRAESSGEAAGGLSLARLREVAADVGISPLHVEAAAREVMLHRDAPAGRSLLGLPRELRAARIAPGAVGDAQWERMVSEFRQIFGKSGIPSQFGEVREWVSSNEAGETMPVTVRVEPGSGGTDIVIHQRTVGLTALVGGVGTAFAGTSLLLGGLMLAGDFAGSVMMLPLLMLLFAVATVIIGWIAGKSWAGRQQEQIEKAADRAELIARSRELQSGATASAAPSGSPPPRAGP